MFISLYILFIVGMFVCTDKDYNIILASCQEYLKLQGMQMKSFNTINFYLVVSSKSFITTSSIIRGAVCITHI